MLGMFTRDVCGEVSSVGRLPGGVIGSRFHFLMGLIKCAVDNFYRATLLGELYSIAF